MNGRRQIFRDAISLPSRTALVAITMAAVLVSSAAFASTPQGHFEKTFQVTGAANLEVQTHSGDIIVRSGPAGSVSIRGKIFVGDHWLAGNRHAEVSEIEQNPPLRQEGNNIRVDYVNTHDISVDYEITVPADTTVRTHSGSGDQTIEDIHGNSDLRSGSGDMRLSRLTGEIRVQTGSGNVQAREIAGPVRGQVYVVNKPRVVIGRASADMVIQDSEISRWHSALEIKDPPSPAAHFVLLLHYLLDQGTGGQPPLLQESPTSMFQTEIGGGPGGR